jgi:hypothetical protein
VAACWACGDDKKLQTWCYCAKCLSARLNHCPCEYECEHEHEPPKFTIRRLRDMLRQERETVAALRDSLSEAREALSLAHVEKEIP